MNATPTTSENRLTSERHKAFQDALETLYIKSNISGRLKFAQDWPDIALHVFGEELAQGDREGLKDKSRRAALEQDAEDRRLKLLDFCAGLEQKSAAGGVLNVDFVQGVVKNLGRGASLYLYSSWIVDKFLPPPAAAEPVIKTPTPQASTPFDPIEKHSFSMPEAPTAPAPLPTLQPITPPGLDMETIRPISLESQSVEPIEKPVAESAPVPPAAPTERKRLKLFGIKDTTSDKA